ncbi:HAMP domain-containing sensor histidine kinase [Temperatibacter marinus]|uniref:histidine kinase n=1 Tax=Temperatibacter marinus TaxID=1456591 RepID=A0AA52HAX7_9PROT|nr:HAMP domain-containing sensor histidine kinase [Temperatibacter marinus]WND04057.1 HAMP domain-containing sensor histidine kinase [Temperatibacter marinus]
MAFLSETFTAPSFYLFIALLMVPIMLHQNGAKDLKENSGYGFMQIGSIYLALGGFLDFAEETTYGAFLNDLAVGHFNIDDILLVAIYAPAILSIGYGLSTWLPDIKHLSEEIERRKTAENDLIDKLQEIEHLAVRAEEANHAKSQFLSTMSHELRTPLNAVIGFAEMLRTDYARDNLDKQDEYQQYILHSGQHLLDLINDILDLSKIEAGKVIIDYNRFDTADLVEDLIQFQHIHIKNKNLDIHVANEGFLIISDYRVLKQIGLNLISNSIKFCEEGRRISISLSQKNNHLELIIEDEGYGIPADKMKSIMEPFTQIERSYSRTQEGSGLGLSIVNKFTQLLDGDFILQSEEGVGTKATVIIPLPYDPYDWDPGSDNPSVL